MVDLKSVSAATGIPLAELPGRCIVYQEDLDSDPRVVVLSATLAAQVRAGTKSFEGAIRESAPSSTGRVAPGPRYVERLIDEASRVREIPVSKRAATERSGQSR